MLKIKSISYLPKSYGFRTHSFLWTEEIALTKELHAQRFFFEWKYSSLFVARTFNAVNRNQQNGLHESRSCFSFNFNFCQMQRMRIVSQSSRLPFGRTMCLAESTLHSFPLRKFRCKISLSMRNNTERIDNF